MTEGRDGADPSPAETIEALQRKIRDYERWFRFLDSQNRVLERERQKLSAVLNHSDAGFLVMLPTLQVVSTNSLFSSRFRSTVHTDEIQGAECHEVLCHRESRCEECPVARVFAQGQVSHLEIQLEVDGRSRFLYATVMPIKAPYGATEEALVMLQDVSDMEALRRTREALRESEETYRRLVETIKVAP